MIIANLMCCTHVSYHVPGVQSVGSLLTTRRTFPTDAIGSSTVIRMLSELDWANHNPVATSRCSWRFYVWKFTCPCSPCCYHSYRTPASRVIPTDNSTSLVSNALSVPVNFFWRQSEGGTDSGWCISGGNHFHWLRKGLYHQKNIHFSVLRLF
jgi:hypothetical protein